MVEITRQKAIRPGYKQTEVGLVPLEWGVKPLNSVAERIMVGIASAATHAYRDRGVVLLRNQNIKPGHLDDGDILYVSPDYEATFKNKRLKSGDLLTARTGYPGTTCVVPPAYESAQSFTTLITRPDQRAVDSSYLCHYINSEQGQAFFEQNQAGGGQKNVNAGSLKQMPVPVPSVAEQRTIATALSDVDALITSLDSALAKKQNIKTGAMQQLLTGKQRLPGFSGEWKVKLLGDVVQIVSGGTPRTGVAAFWDGEIKWCTPTDITRTDGKYLFETERTISVEGLDSCSAQLLPSGALLLCSRATIGEVKIAVGEICTNQGFKSLICGKEINNEFLYYLLLTMKPKMVEKAIGSTFLEISKKDTASLEVLLPRIDEQIAIAQVLSDMDADIAELEVRRDKTRALKQGMMQQLLTGNIRLV